MSDSEETADTGVSAAYDDENLEARTLYRATGLRLFRHRRFREAAAQFSQWARQDPDDPESFLFLARTLSRLAMYDYARAAAEVAARHEATVVQAARVLAQISEREAAVFAPLEAEREAKAAPTPIALEEIWDVPEVGKPVPEGLVKVDLDAAHVIADDPVARYYRGLPRHAVSRFASTVLECIDWVVELVRLEKSLILRIISYSLSTKPSLLFYTGGIMIFIVIFHAMLFTYIGKAYAGQISMVSGTCAAFMNWTCFTRVKSRCTPTGMYAKYNVASNIKWIHLFLAEVIWDVLRIILGVCAIFVAARYYLPNQIALPLVMPNIPAFVFLLCLSVLVGTGVGLIMTAVEEEWPMLGSANHIIVWLMYFSCGVYESYIQSPQIVSQYIKINPLLTITEYARHAFDATYPVADLTLWYPVAAGFGLVLVGLTLRRFLHNKAAAHA